MPKLRRMRLSSIGYDSARFDDVTLDFTDRQGRPTNSILWLRNGGGKTSLLSLLFAGIRTNKRDFLGQRADEKVRRLSDYVGSRDHGVVVCEWELDAEHGLFNEGPPRYLSGVFYQRKESDGGSGDPDVERLFFATLVSPQCAELTLEGLPVFTQELGEKRRRTLNSFRRRLRQLDHERPDHGVFVEDKIQSRFEEELASRGIDPEVFFYQIRMNEREGGVSERFSFAEDEDFIDFLLEMTFDQRHARQVLEQLGTFRQEIFERNEQLRPELECCRGLIARLQRLAGISQERANVLRDSATAQSTLFGLLAWTADWISRRTNEVERMKLSIREAERIADESSAAAGRAERLGSAHDREALRLRRDAAQADYDAGDGEFRRAKRHKEVWQAAVPLARVWDARKDANRLREQLTRKLTEYAPVLEAVQHAATQFAEALAYASLAERGDSESLRASADLLRQQADKAREDASAAGEASAEDEQRAKGLEESVKNAIYEEKLLREQGTLQPGDDTVPDAQTRLVREQAETDIGIEAALKSQDAARHEQNEVRPLREAAERDRLAAANELAVLRERGKQATARRTILEQDVALLRLLQTNTVDVEAACTGAMAQATDELRRVLEEILRIRVDAAEDERAIHALEETNLLPPSQDVQSLVIWLRAQGVRCWSGWEYISSNVEVTRQRTLVRQLPYVATGIVVLDSDYDRVVALFSASPGDDRTPPLRAPLVIAPTDAMRDGLEVLWTVVGPTSDAHFDKESGALVLNQLTEGRIGRQKTIDQHQEWHNALVNLKLNLHKFHDDHPRGWFSEHRQKSEIAESRLEEATRQVGCLNQQLLALQTVSDQAGEQLQTLRLHRAETTRRLDRLDQFQRRFGKYLLDWKREIVVCRERAAKSRQLREERRLQAQDCDARSRDASDQAQAATLRASQLDAERAKVKHVGDANRPAVAGAVEELRRAYELLLADYEGKVNADALSQMATDRDREAEKEEREFQRVLSRLTDVTVAAVEAELKQLPAGLTAQQHLETGDAALEDAFRRMGPLKNRLNAIEAELTKAEQECVRLAAEGALPALDSVQTVDAHAAEAAKAWKDRDEHIALAAAFRDEAEQLTNQLRDVDHDIERTGKDCQRLEFLSANHQPEFVRLMAESTAAQAPSVIAPPATMENAELVRRVDGLTHALSNVRARHAELDRQREEVAREISGWARLERFGKLRSSISFRFIDRPTSALEANAEFDIRQLDDRMFQITTKLEEADKHREIVVQVLTSAVDEALELLSRISRLSRLPERLPQAGQQFVKIETKASDNPIERRAHVGEFIDEQLEHGEVGDGLELIRKAVRRVARRITVRVLHPDLHHKTERVSMADMRRFSGGERLTMAILLYCALIRLRRGETNRRSGSSVLILDNPIGTASRVSFLDMQREVARAMNVQLIYATAVKDLNAVGALENVIRLRNTRVDRRSGRHFIEVDGHVNGELRQLAAARIVFDAAPGSQVSSNRHACPLEARTATSEAKDDA